MKTWTPKAELYDFGRPFPAKNVVALFAPYIDKSTSSLRVFEPGCGTGRVLIPLAKAFQKWNFIGIDSSRDCVEVLKQRTLEQELNNINVFESTIEDFVLNDTYDLIIHSSVLHVIPNWTDVLKRLCDRLSKDGTICLIGDYGDIYSEALGRNDRNGVDPNLANFWRLYIQLRADLNAPTPESSQTGCRWDLNSTEISHWLEQNNFYESDKSEIIWDEKFLINDLLRIVEERCYSSMFTLDKSLIDQIILSLKAVYSDDNNNEICCSKHEAICKFYKRKG